MEWILTVLTLLPLLGGTGDPDREVRDTLPASAIVSSVKQPARLEQLSSLSTSAFVLDMEQRGIGSPRRLSALVPNLHIPDYGSSMTSSVYLRGFGSRIDNPVIALYIDDIPILDKNQYDFDFLDIRRADLLRGPQGTLYGRNAMVGVLSLSTLGPSSWQGVRASAEYGSGGTLAVRGSWYGERLGVAAALRHTDGFYTNEFDGRRCDPSDEVSLRLRHERDLRDGLRLDQTLSLSWLEQGGWPYRQWQDGQLRDVDYNDRTAYRRISVLAGNKLTRELPEGRLHSITSLQGLFDRMDLDQDFTRASMFTLTQRQRQGALTQEFVFEPVRKTDGWERRSGAFALVRYNAMHAPVHFKEDGIRSLILDNANAHMPEFLGALVFGEDNFVIDSDFGLLSYNLALYHESVFLLGRWRLTAGLRLDHEGAFMDYDSRALIHYRLTGSHSDGRPLMPEFRGFETAYAGGRSNLWFQVLPKLSALYDAGDGQVYATLSKGFKSGGFNTQLFSDILQGMMMDGLMADMGIYLDNTPDRTTAQKTAYKPETGWNFEVGGRYARGAFRGQAALYYILCRNQQLTVFPPGMSTGRMMTNAGRSSSYGTELEASWRHGGWNFAGAWGYVHAVFDAYSDGNADYSGCRIPYAPEQTLSLRGSYRLVFSGSRLKSLTLGADLTGTGRIWWDEDNSLSQPFYALAGGDVTLSSDRVDLFVQGSNLLGREFDTFYFKSVGNQFFQRGKPRRLTAGIRLNL